MVAFILTSTTNFPTETSCAIDILPVIPASNQPVSKDSFDPDSNFKRSQMFESLNIKYLIKTSSLDWLLLRNLSDFGKEDKKSWARVI